MTGFSPCDDNATPIPGDDSPRAVGRGRATLDAGTACGAILGGLDPVDRASARRSHGADDVAGALAGGSSAEEPEAPVAGPDASAPGAVGAATTGASAGADEGSGGGASAVAGAVVGVSG